MIAERRARPPSDPRSARRSGAPSVREGATTMDPDAANALVVRRPVRPASTPAPAIPHMVAAIERHAARRRCSASRRTSPPGSRPRRPACRRSASASRRRIHMRGLGRAGRRGARRGPRGDRPRPRPASSSGSPRRRASRLIPQALEEPETAWHRPDACASAPPSRTSRARCRTGGATTTGRSSTSRSARSCRRSDFFPGALPRRDRRPVGAARPRARDRRPRPRPGRRSGPSAPNVHVARWVPQADVMPHAAAMICHGGSGTVTRGRWRPACPLACVPLFADQPHNASASPSSAPASRSRRTTRPAAGDAVRAGCSPTASYREAARARRGAQCASCRPVDTASGQRSLRALRWRARASRARWRGARPGRGRPRRACRRCCAGAYAPCSSRARARARSACRPCPGRAA